MPKSHVKKELVFAVSVLRKYLRFFVMLAKGNSNGLNSKFYDKTLPKVV